MNDQSPETHRLRHEPCGGSARLWRRLEMTGTQGLVEVQGNRNGDEYHQALDLVLDFFLIQNHKSIDCIGIVSSVPDATNIVKPEVAHYYVLTVL